MTKHTPGEWFACLNGKCKCGMIRDKDAITIAICKSTETADDDGFKEYHPTVEQNEANMHLIAAAPKMLEALKFIGDRLSPEDRPSHIRTHEEQLNELEEWIDSEILPKIQDVIAKAEGKPELLPCPFCGGEAVVSENNSNIASLPMFFIKCCSCGSEGRREFSSDAVTKWRIDRALKEAVSNWNRRTRLTEADPEMLKALQELTKLYGDAAGWFLDAENKKPQQDFNPDKWPIWMQGCTTTLQIAEKIIAKAEGNHDK